MTAWPGHRTIAIVTACMSAKGKPDFVLTEVSVTHEEVENGIHYYLAEADLLQAGYEEPFCHFDEFEAPPFLHGAVWDYLALAPIVTNPTSSAHWEEATCPA